MKSKRIAVLGPAFLGALIASAPVIADDNRTQPSATSTPVTVTSARPKNLEQTGERIHLQDRSVEIHELRVGGQTRQIDVQPKSNMPAYQIAPSTGERSWKVIGF